MKRGKKHFSQKKFSHPNKKVYKKYFKNLKIICYNCDKKGHYARECQAKQIVKEIFDASTAIEDETTQKNAFDGNERKREYYLVLALFGSVIKHGW